MTLQEGKSSVNYRLIVLCHTTDTPLTGPNFSTLLSQALAVAKAVPTEIDLANVEAWAESEGGGRQFKEFLERLQRT